jgi:hypothetical protein
MTGKDMWIGVLSITAVILMTGLALVHTLAPPAAMAFGQNDRAGDYLATTTQVDDTVELLVIVDTAAQRMNAYMFNTEVGQVELVTTLDVRTQRGPQK